MSTTPPTSLSLSKYIAQAGFASRRNAAALVKTGKVTLNGQLCINPGTRIDPTKDKIACQQKRNAAAVTIALPKNYNYLVINKPTGYLCTTTDPFKRKTVYHLIPDHISAYPVGRLDQDSKGLLILTNDGFFNNQLTNPKFHIPKTYQVTVLGKVTTDQLTGLRNMGKNTPTTLEDITITIPAQIKLLESTPKKSVLEFVLKEGKKRQIRRMAAAVRLHVLDLKRTQVGCLTLGSLKEGHWRRLSKEETIRLKKEIASLQPKPVKAK